MREILFRGFHKNENGKQKVFVNGEWIKGEWVYGYPVIDTGDCSLKAEGKCFCPHDGTSIFFWDDDFHEYTDCNIIPETLGQYTGLTDKNGNKIFEGDICSFLNNHNIYLIVWNRHGWQCKKIGGDFSLTLGCSFPLWQWDNCKENGYRTLEVIGNIHDNPELLEVVQNE